MLLKDSKNWIKILEKVWDRIIISMSISTFNNFNKSNTENYKVEFEKLDESEITEDILVKAEKALKIPKKLLHNI